MIRGTTAQFKFNLPYELRQINYVEVFFWQPGDSFSNTPSVEIPKTISGYSSDKKILYVSLHQEETKLFSEKKLGYVQLRGVAADGTVFASKQESFIVYPYYSNGSIGEPPEINDDNNDGWSVIDSGYVGSILGG